MKIKIFFSQGTHVIIDDFHILFDPSYTTDNHIDYEEYEHNRNLDKINKNYSSVDAVFISHAHTDHCDKVTDFRNTKVPIYAHHITISIKPNFFKDLNYHKILEGEQIILSKNISVFSMKANHCAGSLMFLIIANNKKILYTGDYNLHKTLSFGNLIIPKCEILISEATFANEKYVFENEDIMFRRLFNYIDNVFKSNKVIFIVGQSLGKMQELIKYIRENNKPYKIFVDNVIFTITKEFEKYYGKFPNSIPHFSEPNNELIKDFEIKEAYSKISFMIKILPNTLILIKNFDIIHNILKIRSKLGIISTHIIILSGLEKEHYSDLFELYENVTLFNISNHADFNDIKNMIEKSEAKNVCLFHGFADDFANKFKDLYNVINLHKDTLELEL